MRLDSLSLIALLLVLAACATPKGKPASRSVSDCCAAFGIDVDLVLGPKGVNCGTINSKPDTAAERDRTRKAMACVRASRNGSRATVVNQGYSISPDYYLRNVLVFGALGEKILVQIEQMHDGATYSISSCDVLRILDNGDLEYDGCRTDDALQERMKLKVATTSE